MLWVGCLLLDFVLRILYVSSGGSLFSGLSWVRPAGLGFLSSWLGPFVFWCLWVGGVRLVSLCVVLSWFALVVGWFSFMVFRV